MKLWQKAMITLARSERASRLVQGQPRLDAFARRFVGGESLDRALDVADELRAHNLAPSLYFLGEYHTDSDIVEATVAQLTDTIRVLGTSPHDLCVSVDPTQIGLMIDEATCTRHTVRLAEAVQLAAAQRSANRSHRSALMIDMEDSTVTGYTLDLHRQLRADGHLVAVTIQAYLHRTDRDLDELIRDGAWIRLVKGAFAESRDVAVRRRNDVDSRFRTAAKEMLSAEARAAGCYPAFGTHDDVMIKELTSLAAANRWERTEYEFEMLLGVRPDLQRHLAREGFRVRVYIPFGQDWFPYAIRRVGESPRNLRFAARAALSSTQETQGALTPSSTRP